MTPRPAMLRPRTGVSDPPAPAARIGDRAVGKGCPVYVIAEAGVNHNGDPTQARALIDAAKSAGADAVKFQIFRADSLVAADAPTCAYQQDAEPGAHSQREMLRRLELT